MFGLSKIFIAVVVIASLMVIWLQFGRTEQPQRLTFLAVGQGDCIVWQDRGATVLIDTGPKARSGFDAGARIVIPKLRQMGVNRVDMIIITHPDADHIGGLRSMLKRYPEAQVMVSAEFKMDEEMQWWLRDAELAESEVVWTSGRYRIKLPTSIVEVVAPKMNPDSNDNEGSLFARIECGLATAVLTGDAGTWTEDSLQRSLNWRAQVLKIGHHGSRTSTSESFVKSLQCAWGVISCGRDNRFDHPHKSVLSTLERQGISVLRTDLVGDITFSVGKEGFQPKPNAPSN